MTPRSSSRSGWWLAALLVAACPELAHADDDTGGQALSYGAGGCGKLEGGVALPCSGDNFAAFSTAACAAGRNYLHPLVQATVLDAYAALAKARPHRRWQYGEMGLRNGGSLWPHRTHQSGVSADFFVPVTGDDGRPTSLSISPLNKFGYGHELDAQGRLDDLSVDWKALAAHLLALERAGKKHGVKIGRVILTPDYHSRLFKEAPELRHLRSRFLQQEAWIRHDEHYHVDFEIPRALRRRLKCSAR